MERIALDTVVIGAGAVGLAVTRALQQAGREVLLLKTQPRFGKGASSQNSEANHAEIYYRRGSRKALLSVRGKHLLYDYRRRGRFAEPGDCQEIEQKGEARSRFGPRDARSPHPMGGISHPRDAGAEEGPKQTCVQAALPPLDVVVDRATRRALRTAKRRVSCRRDPDLSPRPAPSGARPARSATGRTAPESHDTTPDWPPCTPG
jgi:glycine/D-amino acid oxidase-like deaminating enzyme